MSMQRDVPADGMVDAGVPDLLSTERFLFRDLASCVFCSFHVLGCREHGQGA